MAKVRNILALVSFEFLIIEKVDQSCGQLFALRQLKDLQQILAVIGKAHAVDAPV